MKDCSAASGGLKPRLRWTEPPVNFLGRSLESCILCGGDEEEVVLDLGTTALANKFLTAAELSRPESAFPLRLAQCPACGHVQLADRVPPAMMFEDYLYMSSLSDTLVRHLHSLARDVTAWRGLEAADLAVDVGCNDCTLLEGFRRQGVRILGVDPAQNLAGIARDKGVTLVSDFFGAASARDILAAHGPAAAITATNVFPHIPDLADFLTGVETLLEPKGVLVIEAHYLLDMLEQAAFDTIYHEHVSYWSLAAMQRLFTRHGFEVVDCARLPIHHGQLRVFVQRRGVRPAAPAVERLLAAERAAGVPGRDALVRFADQARGVREGLRRSLAEIRAKGGRVAGYGAPAKGSTLLAYAELSSDDVMWIADRSPLKQGRFTPQTHIPVVPPERILEDMPDFLLLLAWNFADEVMAQQAEYRRRAGKFILPVPEVRVVS
jgi:predicted TPR repeat methyltransferase